MSQDVIDTAYLLKQRHRCVLKCYEMSEATFRQLELEMKDNLLPLNPDEQRARTVPFGEIQPIYA